MVIGEFYLLGPGNFPTKLILMYQGIPGKIRKSSGLEGNDHDRMNIVYGLKYDACFSEPHGLCSKIRHICQLYYRSGGMKLIKTSPWLLFFQYSKFKWQNLIT